MNTGRQSRPVSLFDPLREPAAERWALEEESFKRVIAIERKRTERSKAPFVLMLLEIPNQSVEKTIPALESVMDVLLASSRDTDLVGWYKEKNTIGALFTGLVAGDKSAILTTILSRVSNTLRDEMTFEQFSLISISLHYYPDEWDQNGPGRPSNPALYPDLSGQWTRVNLHKTGQITFDQTKGWGREQQAPLTPEYRAIHEASLADQANGGQGNWYSGERCLPPGMPATMNGYNTFEFVVLPEITYVLNEHNLPIQRRIYTDGRDWPADIEPSFQGYSIGRWVDSEHKGRFDTLEVETRVFKGPRAIDPTGGRVLLD